MSKTEGGLFAIFKSKSNHYQEMGRCAFCGQFASLSAYDIRAGSLTSRKPPQVGWKTMLRVYNECGQCHCFNYLTLDEWEGNKQQSIDSATEKLRENPKDPGPIIELIRLAIGYRDRNILSAVVNSLAQGTEHEPDVQAQLGHAHCVFNELPAAVAAGKRSLAAKDTVEIREQLIYHLILAQRTEEANDLLADSLAKLQLPRGSHLCRLLGKAFHLQADFESADKWYAKARDLSPELDNQKSFVSQRRLAQSKRNLKRAHKELRWEAQGFDLAADPPRKFSKGLREALIVGGFAALVFLAFVGYSVYKQFNRQIYVVNGLSVPYDVQIGEQSLHLEPYANVPFSISEGTHSLSWTIDGQQVEAEPFTIQSSFWRRPFLGNDSHVINPDMGALLAKETIHYAVQPQDAPPGFGQYNAGHDRYEFGFVDFQFVEFPKTVKIPEGKEKFVKRLRVTTYTNDRGSYELQFNMLSQLDTPTDSTIAALQRGLYDPREGLLLQVALRLIDQNTARAKLDPWLKVRPPIVRIHRAYQNLMETTDPNHDLIGEYRQLLQGEPTSAEFKYLLARLVVDPEESDRLLNEALQGSELVAARARMAQSFAQFTSGQFEPALQMLRGVPQLPELGEEVEFQISDNLLALGKYDELIALITAKRPIQELPMSQIATVLRCAVASQGGVALATEYRDKFLRGLANDGAKYEVRESWSKALSEVIVTASGDLDQWSAFPREEVAPDVHCLQEIVAKNYVAAADVLDKEVLAISDDDLVTLHLLLYTLASQAGQSDLAKQQKDQAVSLLSLLDADSRYLATELADAGVSKPDWVVRLGMTPHQKRVILTALGIRYPEHKQQYFELAKKLNFQLDATRFVLERAFAAQP